MTQRIYYTKPSITEREVELAIDATRNGWGEQCYEYIERFETLFKNYTGVKYAIATSSCTGALHMGMAALGIGPGDEVILADTNWIASAAPITYLGAKPVFVDILQDSWCIDPNKLEAAITPKTKAIMAVHLYGNLCNMEQLQALGEKYNLPLIEDSAEAIGSFWHGQHTGTIGKFGTFSFHGTKTVTTGEGGMFITNDKTFFEKVLTLSNHGRARNQRKQFWPDLIGYKYKMSNLQAAIGCAQMERIEQLVDRKRQIFFHYQKHLSQLDCLYMNPEKTDTINSFWMPTIVFNKKSGITREKIINAFSKKNIDARVFFWPLSSLDMFESVFTNTNAREISERAVNLPSYYDMSLQEQNRVIDVIYSILDKA